MKELKIQTLHPDAGKKNKQISIEKYKLMKSAILSVLQYNEPTHTRLMNELIRELKGKFTGTINWYAMTVKLDLEARGIIERTKATPATYRRRNTHVN